MSNKNAVIYVRVSTKDQDEKFSPDVQLNMCQAYANKKSLEVIKEFREARSGWKANARVEFYQMVDFINERKIGNLICAYADRLGRSIEDYALLKSTGVTIHIASSGIFFTLDKPEDYELIAGYEHGVVESKRSSAQLSNRVTLSQREKVQRGEYPGPPPLGYLPEPHIVDGKWKYKTVQDRDRAPLMKKMFELYSSGEYSLRQITEKMKNLGLRSKNGRVLSRDEIRRYLRTHFYYGVFQWFGKLYPNKDTYKPLISKELYDRVQEVLDGKRVSIKRGKQFKYKGLLTCDLCGCAVVGDDHSRILKSTGEKKSFIYYHCTSGKRPEYYQEHYGSSKCPLYYGPYYTEQEIDSFFEEHISLLYVDPQVDEWVQNELAEDYQNLKDLNEEEVRSLNAEKTSLEHKEGFIVGEMPKANPRVKKVYERQLEKSDRRMVEIEARLEELKKGEEAVSLEEINETLVLSKSLKDIYLAASPEKREKLNKLMFITVRIATKGCVAGLDEDDKAPTISPFYFVWNEPFKSLWEIGFIQGMSEAEAEWQEKQETKKSAKIKKGRAWRDSNSRPAA